MPAAKTTNFTVRLDTKVKADAEKLFNDLGMTLSGAFNIFLHQALLVQGLPFAVRKEPPNKETLAAMREAIALADNPASKTYASAAELMRDIEE